MAVYLLPVRADRVYRGAHPTRVYSFGFSRDADDCDGNQYASIELNNGERYSVSTDCLRPVDKITGVEFADILRTSQATKMPNSVYDKWLSDVRAGRAANRFGGN